MVSHFIDKGWIIVRLILSFLAQLIESPAFTGFNLTVTNQILKILSWNMYKKEKEKLKRI